MLSSFLQFGLCEGDVMSSICLVKCQTCEWILITVLTVISGCGLVVKQKQLAFLSFYYKKLQTI